MGRKYSEYSVCITKPEAVVRSVMPNGLYFRVSI